MAQDKDVQGNGSVGSAENLQYATLANAAPDGLFQVDENDRLVAVNDAFRDAAGRSRDELVGAPLERAFPSADADRLSAARQGLFGSESDTVTLSASLPGAGAERQQCEIQLQLVDDANGDAAGCVRTLDSSTDDAPGSTLSTDFPGIVYRCRNERGWPMESISGGCASLSGYEPAALTAGEVSWGEDVIDERDREAVWTEIQSALDGDDDFECEYRIRTADGETKWVTERGHAVRDDAGEVTDLEGFITDVTDHRRTHERLHEETEKFQSLVDAVEEYAIFMLDPDGKIVSWNQGAEQIKGYDIEEALGEHFSMFYTDEDRAAGVPESNLAGATEEGSLEDEGWRVRKDGSRFWANVVITPVRDEDGTLTGYAKVTRDMTERRENEAALRRERNLVTQILETSPVGISLVDEDNQLVRTNERAAEFAGRTPGELLELSATAIDLYDEDGRPVPPEDHPSRRVLEAGESVVGGEYQIEQPDGTWRWLSIDATTIEDANEARVVLAVQDITPIKQREAELRKERDLTERILETSPIGIAVLSAADQVEHVNERGQEILGIDTSTPDPATAEGRELLFDQEGEPVSSEERPSVRAFSSGEQVTDWQCQYDHPNTGLRWLSVNATPVFDDDDEVERVITVGDDITQHKEQAHQLERQRDELEHELGEVFERVDDAFLALDKEWRFTYVNEKARELVGGSRSELLGTGIWEIAPEVVDSEFHREAKRALESQEAVNFEGYYAPLATWFEVSAYPSETGLSVYFRDVTERKERERQLETYETIFETVDDGVYVCDEDFRFTMVNDAYVEMTGYNREQLLGAPASLVVDEAVSVESAEQLQEITAGESASGTLEADINRADGSQLRAESKFTAIPSDDAEPPRKVGVVRDISERKKRERELEESRNRYQALVENFPNGAVALVDEDLRYSTVGGTPIVEADTTVAELEGSLLDEILPPDIADGLVPRYADALDGEPSAFEQEMDGHVYQFWTIPVRNDSGDVFAALGMSQDITERKKREQFLQDAKEQLEAATEAGAVGTWEWHIPENRFVAGTSLAKQFGVGPDAAREGVPLERLTASIHEDDRERVVAEIEAALETCGEYEAEYRTWNADDELRWVIARGHVDCDEDGNPTTFPGALTDITERKQAELQLQRNNEQLESLFEILPVGVVVADANGRLIDANDTAKGIWGGDVFDAESVEVYEKHRATWADSGESIEPEEWTMARVLDGEEVTDPDLFEIEAAEGERRIISAEGMPVRDENGEVTRGVVTFTDITERKKRERELERYETIVETVNDGIYVVDEDGRFTMVNEEYASVTGYDRQELLGADVSLVVDDSTAGQAQIVQKEMADGERDSATLEADIRRADGEAVPAEATFALLEADNEIERIAVVRDVTERKERERELERYETIVETVDDGVYALDPDGDFVLVNDAFCEMTRYDRQELIGQPGKTVTTDWIDETAAQLAAEVVAGERDAATMELELQTADGQSVPVESRFGPYPYDGEQYGRTGVTRDITERLERERALERQREELAALNRLNQIVGEITHAAVESSSREEVEQIVCERLAESESYQFAWIGELERPSGTIALRTEAGVEGYLDNVTLAVNPDDGVVGPTGMAARTGEPQITRNIETSPDYEPWRDHAAEYDFRSSAAIPIVYEDVLYGILNVYSRRVGAFDGYEQALLARLGNVVGHTINAIERKEALMSDQVQEIDLEIADVTSFVDEPTPADGTITFERTVPVGEDTYLQYGTADEAALALLEGLVEAFPSWEDVAVLDERFGEVSFELRLSEPPAISTTATYGGRVQSATIEDGHYQLRVELPPAADVRTVIEALQKEYPSIELVAQRRRARDAWSVRRIDDLLEEQLTDRQRASLKAAYYAGYFDTPRKRSGEAVAKSLEITAPTLHQHLRKGQRKLLAAVFDDSGNE